MVPLDPRVRERLEAVGDDGWRSIILGLTNYAVIRARRLRWRTPAGTLAEGKEAADLAMEAISQVWRGERVWSPDARPDLLQFLKGVVDSRLSHLVESADHVKRRVAAVAGAEEEDALTGVADPAPTPEEALVEAEASRTQQELAARIRDAVRGEEDLELVLLGIEQGKKPMEIAADLGLSNDEVYQLIRKIKRRVHSAAAKQPAR
ncbi:MAG: hypothetical protein A2W26_11575 [Acidobacteria bacterium RBG_16_64_8]|nr:MAG: hypothetical protein A2W26_11575 [Acidobacteria bacterium RBG_16_64_8]